MPNVNLTLNLRRPTGLGAAARTGTEALRYILDVVAAAASGRNQSDAVIYSVNDDEALGATAYASPAAGLMVFASASGTVGATVCGTSVTVTAAGGDAATAAAWATALRGTAAINRRVTSHNLGVQFTVGAVVAGNTIIIHNVVFTATGAAAAAPGEFDASSGVAATIATNLAAAICRHPAMAGRYVAVSAAAVVRVYASTPRTTTSQWEGITNAASTFNTITATPTSLAAAVVLASRPGDIGNECRLASATGTGASVATNGSAGFLGNGTGGGTSTLFVQP